MPLIVLVGTPCSGKTQRARELRSYFEQRGKEVHVVSEEEVIRKLGYEKNTTYLDSQKEKRVRSVLKSEAIKLLGKENVVILDGSNYIKGFRYELYCASKASRSTQCTIYTIRNHDEAERENKERQRNSEQKRISESNIESPDKDKESSSKITNVEMGMMSAEERTPYTDEVFEALTKFRFEEPNSQHRWDSPLFTVQPEDPLDTSALYQALYLKKAPPPNMSTQNPPLSATNCLYDIDRMTQAVNGQLLEAKAMGSARLAGYPDCALEPALLECVTPSKLNVIRRQYLSFVQHQAKDLAVMTPKHYVSYLTTIINTTWIGRERTHPPLSATNFLYDIDQMTQAVNGQLLESKAMGSARLAGYPDCALEPALLECVTPSRLKVIRRQYLSFVQHQAKDLAVMTPKHYVSYLTTIINT